jgi:hypothetical protein
MRAFPLPAVGSSLTYLGRRPRVSFAMPIHRFTVQAATESSTPIFPIGCHKAVAIFSSSVYAEAFAHGYLAAELQVIELTSDTLPPWLANVQCFGVTHAFLDPPPGCELRRSSAATLATVLNDALGGLVQVVDNQ